MHGPINWLTKTTVQVFCTPNTAKHSMMNAMHACIPSFSNVIPVAGFWKNFSLGMLDISSGICRPQWCKNPTPTPVQAKQKHRNRQHTHTRSQRSKMWTWIISESFCGCIHSVLHKALSSIACALPALLRMSEYITQYAQCTPSTINEWMKLSFTHFYVFNGRPSTR